MPDSNIPTTEQIADDDGHYVAPDQSTTPKVVELSETGSFGTARSTDFELSKKMDSDSGNSDSSPPLPPASETITVEKKRGKKHKKKSESDRQSYCCIANFRSE